MRILAVLVTLILAPVSFGASHYEVRLTGPERKAAQTFSVVAEESRLRADSKVAADDVVLFDGVLASAGSPLVALNSQNQTWYELEPPTPFALRSRFLKPVSGRVKKLKAQLEPASGGADGFNRYYGRISYTVDSRLGGETVSVDCSASFEIVTTTALARNRWAGRLLPVTALAEVDLKLFELEQAIDGFPQRMSMTVRRTYAGGGQTMTDTHVVEVSDVREGPADPALFVRPAGYRHQKPVLATPGR